GGLCVRKVGLPKYPPLARAARVTGKVALEFSVKTGVAAEIVPVGHPLLIQSAIGALKDCVFDDSRENGDRYSLTVEFGVIGFDGDKGSAGFDFVSPNYIRAFVRNPPLFAP